MAYATLADLIERAGATEINQIADRDRDGTPDPDVIAAALTAADNLIDGYVGTRFDVPLAVAPALVVTWAVSIARYVLHRNGAPEHVERDYKDSISALKDVAAGRIALPLAGGASPPLSGGGSVLASHPDEVFTSGRLQGWR